MKALKVSNAALGNPAELDRIWREHGYWYFRDVLDKEALGVIRDQYMAELDALGVVSRDSDEPIWNGKPLDDYPTKFQPLHDRRVWQNFVKNPRINAFFEDLLEAPVYWMPIDYYRLVPPSQTSAADPFAGRHQDAPGLPGLAFMTCWIPLTSIDADVGGLAIAEGHHNRGLLAKTFDERFTGVPDTDWARADYRLGDVLIFAPTMPHSGLPNTSGRFRLSLDIRAVRRSEKLPVVGEVKSISLDHVVIHDEDRDEDVRLVLDDNTHYRAMVPTHIHPMPTERSKVTEALPLGSMAFASEEDGRALILRPHV